jgi:DNA (cytosine-5)-methyltransferase 1
MIPTMRFSSLELFAGAGGLGMGAARAGCENRLAVEYDRHACATLQTNSDAGHPLLSDWSIAHKDVQELDYQSDPRLKGVHLVLGGPPCQPFSVGGKARGACDKRDMFPQAVRAVRETQPMAFVFENVFGLLRPSFSTYLEYILLQLSNPSICPIEHETWQEHLSRLERHSTSATEPEFRVLFQELNAVNFGVPQKRRRVFFVGFRNDINASWAFPQTTHSQEALVRSKWIDHSYWDEHAVPKKHRPSPTPRENAILKRLSREVPMYEGLNRWRTVRDAIADLPDPRSQNNCGFTCHEFRDGARSYPGHDGSPLDEPAKALKAGVHGVPGGENMIRFPDGAVRYFTVREAARIQTFPDSFRFPGSWSETMRQLGNAVPVRLGETVVRSVTDALLPFCS